MGAWWLPVGAGARLGSDAGPGGCGPGQSLAGQVGLGGCQVGAVVVDEEVAATK